MCIYELTNCTIFIFQGHGSKDVPPSPRKKQNCAVFKEINFNGIPKKNQQKETFPKCIALSSEGSGINF